MFKRRFRLPSPALVISMVALGLVLGGSAFAANKVVTAKHKDAKADTKLVKKLAPSLSVKHAKTANSATTAASATHATTADSATHATTADSATAATNAINATNATNATNAVNASKVGGYAPNGLTRVAYTIDSATATTSGSTLTTVTLTAPSAGFVVVHADVDVELASSTVTDIIVDVSNEATGDASWLHDGVITNGNFGYSGDVSASAVFPVAAGVNTFDVEGFVGGTGTAPVYIDATAAFSPFGSTGGSTLMPKHTTDHVKAVQPGAVAHH